MTLSLSFSDQLFEAYLASSNASFLDARAHVAEWAKFLSLTRLVGAERVHDLSPPPVCACVWRVALLFTRQYAAACDDLAGFFVHHRPEAATEHDDERRRYRDTHMLYLLQFGSPRLDVWPLPTLSHASARHADFVRARPGYDAVLADFKRSSAPGSAAASLSSGKSQQHQPAAAAVADIINSGDSSGGVKVLSPSPPESAGKSSKGKKRAVTRLSSDDAKRGTVASPRVTRSSKAATTRKSVTAPRPASPASAESSVLSDEEMCDTAETMADCSVCAKPGGSADMCECSGCKRPYHLQCTWPRLLAKPQTMWLCADCSGLSMSLPPEDDVACHVCRRRDREDELLLCDGYCGRAYHLDCMKPPLTALPEGDWFCRRCLKQRAWPPTDAQAARATTQSNNTQDDDDDKAVDVKAGDAEHRSAPPTPEDNGDATAVADMAATDSAAAAQNT
jgi:hypothetical protein